MMIRKPALGGILLLALLLAACARTNVISVWKNENFTGPPMQSIIILAQTGDDYNRSVWEDIIAERFRRSGMNALAAASVFSPDSRAGLPEVLGYARDKGIEGVLVIRHVDTRSEERYHPPRTEYYYDPWPYYPLWPYYYPRYPYYRRYYPYFPSYYYYGGGYYVRPGYTTQHQVVLVESYLYHAGSREQIWSMSTKTHDPRSVNHLIADISRSVFRVLRRYGLITLTR